MHTFGRGLPKPRAVRGLSPIYPVLFAAVLSLTACHDNDSIRGHIDARSGLRDDIPEVLDQIGDGHSLLQKAAITYVAASYQHVLDGEAASSLQVSNAAQSEANAQTCMALLFKEQDAGDIEHSLWALFFNTPARQHHYAAFKQAKDRMEQHFPILGACPLVPDSAPVPGAPTTHFIASAPAA